MSEQFKLVCPSSKHEGLLTNFSRTMNFSGDKVRVCGFDLDDTLINSNRRSKNSSDWEWKFDSVLLKLCDLLCDPSILVVIFTNQSGIGSGRGMKAEKLEFVRSRLDHLIGSLKDHLIGSLKDRLIGSKNDREHFNLAVMVATDTRSWYRKPCTGMWEYLSQYLGENHSCEIDLHGSFYVGDAAGRIKGWFGNNANKRDFSCSDRKFAHNVGIKFYTPEEWFLGMKLNNSDWEWRCCNRTQDVALNQFVIGSGSDRISSRSGSDQIKNYLHENPDVRAVMMVGSPASGKSRLSKILSEECGFAVVNQDTLRTVSKCKAAVERVLSKEDGKVIIDNTNGKLEKRRVFIDLFEKFGCKSVCIWLDWPKDMAFHLNGVRTMLKGYANVHARLPDVVFHTYYKYLVPPSLEEGFQKVFKLKFEPKFQNELHEKVFNFKY
jgi:bifunctional polynucleotide phosphatase/kinase